MLDLRSDPDVLTAALIDIPSVSRDERRIADEVETALREQTGYEVIRNGDAVLARTNLDRPSRVILAGHLDTVPIADNVPSRRDADHIYGCGASDMKSGDAVFLHLAATIDQPVHDITLILYDCEEIEASANGLGRIHRELPKTQAAFVSIALNPARWEQREKVLAANAAIATYMSADPRRRYVDVTTAMLGSDGMPKAEIFLKDRLHMNRQGYEIWKPIIGSVLVR